MINDPNNKISPARLSDTERKDMLREFMLHVDANPVKASGPIRSPYLTFLRHSAIYSLAVFLVLGGTVYAAEGSLPQDPLYGLKTEVLEPVAVKLAPLVGVNTGDAHVALVERRLDEAEALLEQGDLATSSVAILAEKITESSAAVRVYTSKAVHDGHLTEALDTSSDLETLLEGHVEVLSTSAEEEASSTPNTDRLVDVVEEQGDQAEDSSETIEDQVVVASSTEASAYLFDLQEAASSTIAGLQDKLTNFTADADLTNQATDFLTQAEGYFDSGLSHLGKQEEEEALSDLRQAQSAAEKGLILLESSNAVSD